MILLINHLLFDATNFKRSRTERFTCFQKSWFTTCDDKETYLIPELGCKSFQGPQGILTTHTPRINEKQQGWHSLRLKALISISSLLCERIMKSNGVSPKSEAIPFASCSLHKVV